MGLGVSAFLANRVELGYSFMVAFVVKSSALPCSLATGIFGSLPVCLQNL